MTTPHALLHGPTAIQQLSVLQRLNRQATGRARQTLMQLQAEYAEIVGWFNDDLGDRQAGQHWIDRALEWAHEAGDEPFIGYVLARKAQRAADDGDTAAAISLAAAAQKRGTMLSRVRDAALLWGALGYAKNGDAYRFQTGIEQAKELIGEMSGHASERARWCTPGYVVVHEAAGYMRPAFPSQRPLSHRAVI